MVLLKTGYEVGTIVKNWFLNSFSLNVIKKEVLSANITGVSQFWKWVSMSKITKFWALYFSKYKEKNPRIPISFFDIKPLFSLYDILNEKCKSLSFLSYNQANSANAIHL